MTFAAPMDRQQFYPASGLRRNGSHSLPSSRSNGSSDNREPGGPLSIDSAQTGDFGGWAIVFGRFRLVLRSRELSADGVPVPIGNRAIDVLMALIEARGELVTKDELLRRVWPKMTVEENNLQFQISTLRKALGKDRGFIKTVCRRGYRFIAQFATRALERDVLSEPVDGSAALCDLRPATNVPTPASDLIGRETQLSEVAALVDANRLVTLVGAGGIGKTRLGVEIARCLLPNFADGVWIAELGPLSDPALVPGAIAAALGLSDAAEPWERLAASLSSKHLLLVLDNCEHLIDAAANVAESLLHISPSLHVIATSREPLRAEGEWVYRVPPLDVPPDGIDGIEEVLQHSAAKLFAARARAAGLCFATNNHVAAATATICRHLDGIPLAIELASKTAAVLGVEALASRLDERFNLLTDGPRTAPPRHQTLRAALDWSYATLTDFERAVMRRISVLGSEFTIEAASTVAASGDIATSDVMHCLTSLVAKSLVASDVAGPVPRYRMLETTRVYAMDKLAESGEFETVAAAPCQLRARTD
jgi:predicted ATPase/DNA-binding winged helix-turn-helix (wHTH) protein